MTSTRRKWKYVLWACLTASLAGSLSACSGSAKPGPALARADSRPLVLLATRIAQEGACAERRDITSLQRHAVGLVNAGRVPAELQEPLMSGVAALTADEPPCVPTVPVQPTPPPPQPIHPPHPHHGFEHGGHGHHGPGGDQGDQG